MLRVKNVLEQKQDQRVFTIDMHDSVLSAVRLMCDQNIGALVVADQDNIAGIITERDYARKIVLANRSSRSTLVGEVMTRQVLYITPDDAVDSAMVLMTEKRIRHLPVMDQGQLAGMLSIGDILKAVISEKEYVIDQLCRFINGSYTDQPVYYSSFEAEVAELKVVNA